MENVTYGPIRHSHIGFFARLARLIARRRHRQELRRHRQDLARLDAHMLDDIGLTSAEARHEAERLLWDAPRHWWR